MPVKLSKAQGAREVSQADTLPFGKRGHFHEEWTTGGDSWERMEAVDAVFGYAAVMSALANAVMPLFDDSTDGEAGSPIMAGEKASMTTWFWRWRWHVGTASNSGSFSITNSEPK